MKEIEEIISVRIEKLLALYIDECGKWGASRDTSRTPPVQQLRLARADTIRRIAIIVSTGKENRIPLAVLLENLASCAYTRGFEGARSMEGGEFATDPYHFDFKCADTLRAEIIRRFNDASLRLGSSKKRKRK